MGVGRGYGKILLVGGYTILKKPNRGIVLSVRNAYVHAVAEPHHEWHVRSSYGEWKGRNPEHIPDNLRFVRHAITESRVENPHRIVIVESPHFKPGKKLGLGSSAAVTVAVLRALRPDLDSHEVFYRAYRAHVTAQGKIGSGFDVASAVFGSIIYERPSNPDSRDHVVERIGPLRRLHIRLYNIRGRGTETPVSARKVMEAVKTDPLAKRTFEELATLNNRAVTVFKEGKIREFLQLLREINTLRKKLGDVSGVPIEPDELDELRERIERKGYVTVLPGAGGYDSLLVLGTREIEPVRHPLLEEVEVWLR